MERAGGFFSRRLTVIRSAFIRVYRGPRQKEENWRVQTARKYCSVSARENLLPRLLSRAGGRANTAARLPEERGLFEAATAYTCVCVRFKTERGNSEWEELVKGVDGRGKWGKWLEDVGEWVIEEREQWTSRGRNWLVDVEVLERRVLGKRVRERK